MKKHPCTLREYLILGRLSLLELGVSRDTVLEFLGEPKGYRSSYGGNAERPYEKAHTWHYQALELQWHMERFEIQAIYLRTLADKGLPAPLQPVGYFPIHSVSIKKFEAYLQFESIAYTITRTIPPHYTRSNGLLWIHIEPNIYVKFIVHHKDAYLNYMMCQDYEAWQLNKV